MKLVINRVRVEKLPEYVGLSGFGLEMVATHDTPTGLQLELRERDPEQAQEILAAYTAWCAGQRAPLEVEVNLAQLLRQSTMDVKQTEDILKTVNETGGTWVARDAWGEIMDILRQVPEDMLGPDVRAIVRGSRGEDPNDPVRRS